ncbi:MAG: valine--tRNA ligase [Candidatus Chisholmbacteria bacterium RIFCSPLOWO2_01_FULL_50_28]|uniref:Valine--tRNA ligase n=1 Tax=Candidatus Chisholmbacteria bacterium RIFCSPHIGHO2_01_FULL_52_32 TaxID=1797591 RepID=A0A1G1VV67_9BACT|nr:MAG: valine--tRNA ligase [Candidatus Chisholmbacteria bacterium RIFCSPHIGHO2_01_FULL_52_32]OGY19672.1 MAG: valine--tRNA ligase [Candidatus Chisholmbacteria bacterium RIFCSPLOWO2_01_FULL_50_28]
MEKRYNHTTHEAPLYLLWEKSGAFSPAKDSTKPPFCIIMPPPNANGELHLGHATFVAVSDALIRYHRMKGEATLWLPGVDHAGILTQVTFEKTLLKNTGKTRYELGRAAFYRACFDFCMQNKSTMEGQLRALGASCDWSREKFTLDPQVSRIVLETFIRMYNEGLVYRGYRIVNWCPRCRSTLSELELDWEERTDPLYYIKYGPFTLATVRPETKFGDTALAVHPDDRRYKKFIDKQFTFETLLGPRTLQVVADRAVDPKFGTGVVKVTPGHDAVDWEIGQRHHLEVRTVIDFDGRLNELTGPYQGMKAQDARRRVVADMEARGMVEKVDSSYTHSVARCERCGTTIEPLVSRQWFVKVGSLTKAAVSAVRDGKTTIIPKKFAKMFFSWMRNVRDWPISRQIWWGHQLPVWYCRESQKTAAAKAEFGLLLEGDPRARIDALEDPIVSIGKPDICPRCGGKDIVQDPDTFDTWFSSGQWPITTLKTSKKGDFELFYPTSVMNTAYEILFLWVARMIMFGLYLSGEVPFTVALINGVLRDEKGQKMSKSKGNGVDPLETIQKYGADATRMGLLAGRDPGNDLSISKAQMDDRIRGYRNFSNKIWNAVRFILLTLKSENGAIRYKAAGQDTPYFDHLAQLISQTTQQFETYQLGRAAEGLYNEFWHWFCDDCIERQKKGSLSFGALLEGLVIFLKLLHPFVPFVSEACYQEVARALPDTQRKRLLKSKLLLSSAWPKRIQRS